MPFSKDNPETNKFLQSPELLLDRVFNCLDEAVLVVSNDRRLLFINPAATKIFGYTEEEVSANSTEILHVNHDHYLEFGSRIQDAFQKGRVARFEFKAKRKSGEIFPTEHTVSLLQTAEGDKLGIISFVRDITERKQLEEERSRSAQLAALGTVAAGVAHEINNPIQGIMNYATLLERSPERSDRNLEIARCIKDESKNIAEITQDLLFYSKDTRIEKKLVDIQKTIKGALSLIATKVKNQDITLTVDIKDDIPPLLVQPQSIQQIVINLIDNSNDALKDKAGLSEKKISIGASLHKEHEHPFLLLEVYDNGVGMTEEIAKKALEAFFTTKPPAEGTGLGLSIVNDIVKRHDGSIDIDSKEGAYTKINILIPAISADATSQEND